MFLTLARLFPFKRSFLVLEFVEFEQPEDFDGRDLKVALLAERRVVEGRAPLSLAAGQTWVDVNAVAVTKKNKDI